MQAVFEVDHLVQLLNLQLRTNTRRARVCVCVFAFAVSLLQPRCKLDTGVLLWVSE